jgi:hydrogenase nickel incorporation protein HypB
MPQTVPIVENILSANDHMAGENRARLDSAGVYSVNLMASPGAGKTSLILASLEALSGRLRLGVIEGDLAGSIDADRAAAAGIPAVQINTGGECHLDAVMVRGALDSLPLDRIDLLIVENVGNLICPAAFKLGTHLNLLIASIPEGDDKPYKYPGMYRGVQALNPGLATFPLSCRTGEGLPAFADWLFAQVRHGRKKNPR